MRDVFLVFLMVIATAAAGAAGWTWYRSLRGDVDGCAAFCLGVLLLSVAIWLLVSVGHAVGVTSADLGW